MKAKLSITRPSYGDGTRKISITVKENNSRIRFLELEIDYDKFAECITGLSEVECDIEVRHLEKVGKKKQTMDIEVEMPDCGYDERDEVAFIIAQKEAPEGWECSRYFGSQGSFFTANGKKYARTRASRWV